MNHIARNLELINSDINNANVRIIAVSKYYQASDIIDAYQSGIRDFAESKIQDAEKKQSELPDELRNNITWHFIGHLQSNKLKKAVKTYKYIHSVDSVKIAELISEEAINQAKIQKVLIQVNVSNEETKFGFDIKEAEKAFEQISPLKGLEVCGLMTIASNTNDEKILHSEFIKVRDLKYHLEHKFNYPLPELSMGMSSDYKIAVEEGSTMIRLGRILFNK